MIDGTDEGGTSTSTDTTVADATTVADTTTTTDTTTTPTWRDTLPDDLKADATLGRYADVPALAKAHVEQHKTIKQLQGSKLVLPAADAPPEAWDPIFNAIGRPEDAAAYEFPLPEGVESSPLVDKFRPIAHKLGLTAAQAKGIAEFQNQHAADEASAFYAKGEEEVAAIKAELGGQYDAKLAAAKATFAKIFSGDDDASKAEAVALADELDGKLGSGRLMRAMMKLADLAGEHGIIEPDSHIEGLGSVADAEAKLTELQADPGWREKFNKGDASTVAQRNRLLELAQKQALVRGGALKTT
jgi:hypothetical protein